MTKPIIFVKICYKLLYVIQVVKRFLISNFLASTDIKVFGRTYLFAMLLLIGLTFFLHPRCFCLATLYRQTNDNTFLINSTNRSNEIKAYLTYPLLINCNCMAKNHMLYLNEISHQRPEKETTMFLLLNT